MDHFVKPLFSASTGLFSTTMPYPLGPGLFHGNNQFIHDVLWSRYTHVPEWTRAYFLKMLGPSLQSDGWIGIEGGKLTELGKEGLAALIDAHLLKRIPGVVDDHSHELYTVYFPHPHFVQALHEALPSTV